MHDKITKGDINNNVVVLDPKETEKHMVDKLKMGSVGIYRYHFEVDRDMNQGYLVGTKL